MFHEPGKKLKALAIILFILLKKSKKKDNNQ